jgi:hypothetical protein
MAAAMQSVADLRAHVGVAPGGVVPQTPVQLKGLIGLNDLVAEAVDVGWIVRSNSRWRRPGLSESPPTLSPPTPSTPPIPWSSGAYFFRRIMKNLVVRPEILSGYATGLSVSFHGDVSDGNRPPRTWLRSEREVVKDRAIKAWYHPSVAWA